MEDILNQLPDKIKILPPKWFIIKKKLYTIACGGPRGVLTLSFQPSFKIRLERFEEIIKQVFKNFNDVEVILLPPLNLSSSEQKFKNASDPKSPIYLPGAKFTQPACIEVKFQNSSSELIKLIITKLLDSIDVLTAEVISKGLN